MEWPILKLPYVPSLYLAHVQMQDYRRLPPETQSQTDMREFLAQSNPDFAAFLTNPTTNATEVLAQLQSQHLAEMEAKRNSEQANAQPNPFRPSSAHSHRGSVSGSDYSYATTEMDTDEAEHLEGDPQGHVNPNGLVDGNRNGGGMALQTGMTWDMGDMAVDHTYPTPGASNGGPSPPIITHASRIRGPISVIRGPGVDEEEARKRRLERESSIHPFITPALQPFGPSSRHPFIPSPFTFPPLPPLAPISLNSLTGKSR